MILQQFDVLGDPKGQPRPRAFARHGKVRVYDPATAEGWKSSIAATVAQPVTRHDGPVGIALVFRFARPKGHYRRNGTLVPTAPMHHTAKPDADNCAKAVCDALTQIGVWRDDAQVARMTAEKRYVCGDERPGCAVLVVTLPDLAEREGR